MHSVSSMVSLAVVICTHDRSGLLIQTLSTLYNSDYAGPAPVDVLVVANRCSDDTLDRLAEFQAAHEHQYLRLRWIEEALPGKSHALNAAIRETRHEALCFIDDDQLVDAHFLTALAEGLAKHPEYGILCGKMNPAWDGSEPGWVHERGRYFIPIRPFPEYDFGDVPKDIPPGHKLPSGGNVTVRRQVFEQVGNFSTDLGPQGHNLMGGEDHEFLARCLAQGVRILYLPTLRQLHAIEPERMRTSYMLRKSYLRSLSARRMNGAPREGLRPYLLVKPVQYGLKALFTLNANRRFHYLIRMSAALGELHAAVEN